MEGRLSFQSKLTLAHIDQLVTGVIVLSVT